MHSNDFATMILLRPLFKYVDMSQFPAVSVRWSVHPLVRNASLRNAACDRGSRKSGIVQFSVRPLDSPGKEKRHFLLSIDDPSLGFLDNFAGKDGNTSCVTTGPAAITKASGHTKRRQMHVLNAPDDLDAYYN